MDGRYPAPWRKFLVACWDMFSMMALPIAALVVFIALMLDWPGPLIGLAVLLVLAWTCNRYAQRLGREHHW